MINREDMLELTRRMTLKRNSVTRIAGAYMDEDGEINGTFNTNFLNLSQPERVKNLAIAKAIPFSKTNEELKEYRFSPKEEKPGSMWQILMAMKECGLKNDALMEIFYESIGEKMESEEGYAVYVFHGRYDVPLKAKDKDSLWESEEVYEYIICAVCPLIGEYEPGTPEYGFLFPAFSDRSGDIHAVDVFRTDMGHLRIKLKEEVLAPFLEK